MSSSGPRLLCMDNAIRFTKNSYLTSQEPSNNRPPGMCRLIHRKLKHNKVGQLVKTTGTTQQPICHQNSSKRPNARSRIRNNKEIKNWSNTQTGENKTLLSRGATKWNTLRRKSRWRTKALDKENFQEKEEDGLTYINLWLYKI